MSKLLNVSINSIDANPFRQLDAYPWLEHKIEALQRSIADVGFWEGVIARKVGDRFQLAFGHHRIEAARRSGLTSVRLVIRDLTDQQMLQFMGRENGDDYKSDFSIMLNTWDGAVKFAGSGGSNVEIAKLLGWTRKDTSFKNGYRMNHIASACANARKLADDGHIETSDLSDITVSSAEKIVAATAAKIKRIEKNAEGFGHTAEQVQKAKATVAKAAKSTAKAVRDGAVADKQVTQEVEMQTYQHAMSQKEKQIPDFTGFVKKLSDTLFKTLSDDASNAKLEAVIDAMPSLGSHNRELDRIEYDLNAVADRATDWVARLRKARNASPVTDINEPKRLGVVK